MADIEVTDAPDVEDKIMKRLDAALFGIVFAVWGALALMYATIPIIQMPSGVRVWGLGALLFLVLTGLLLYAGRGRGNE